MTLVEPSPIPRAAGSLPLFGHAFRLFPDPLPFIASLRREYGPLVEITLQPGTNTLVVQDPTLIRAMLTDPIASTLDKGPFFDEMRELLGDSVVTVAGDEHTAKRRQMYPAFARPELGRYVDIMRTATEAELEAWAPGQRLDVRETMIRLSLDMLTKTVFSDRLAPATFRQLRQNMALVMDSVGVRIMLPGWAKRLPLPVNRRFDRARADIRATISAAVTELRATGHDTGDMLSVLMTVPDEQTGQPPTDEQICNEVLTLALAGTENTATILAWVLYELARHPDIEADVLDELGKVLGDRPVTFADTSQLPLLDRVIKEVLRLHVTGWILTRRTLTETTLGQWTLPAGTNLAYCQHALHRDPGLYPDPLRFDPDRWLDGTQKPPPGALLSWGAGKHRCIGDRFAMMELITGLATILRQVRFTLKSGQTVRPVARATVRPGKMVMTVEPRQTGTAV
ncbi:cytochrome P450 [Streptomyces sp. ISL-98]|uniref:cytochrome P450 n=1 Tax=Streptomyces sp. ISL-98 TaxID=2819192 RepID=UPI001BEB88C4|nr:cytochrome P450 [Streptomyces sp. ISL-98]MBT2510489.1 cytochrome P450 [Streptomyces sp. ISL-98]